MTLSVRLESDVEQAFELEIKRLKTTKSQFVNQLLREALRPKDPMQLLLEIRARYGIATPGPDTLRTTKSENVSALVRQTVALKHDESRIS
jgi:metal-responsive CopG/Arc/MetJ family transcriptional regulator